MEFGLLGPLYVHDGQEPVPVAAPMQRALLCALMVRAGQPVFADQLTPVIWQTTAPPDPQSVLRVYLMRLRRTLGERAGARIVTRSPGYLLDAQDTELDFRRFTALYDSGVAAADAGAWARAEAELSAALGLWRGLPLADVPSEVLTARYRPGFEELRLAALRRRIEADLHLGRHEEVIGELRGLVHEHPLREPFHGQLMLALHRAGRTAEALAAYQDVYGNLVEQLGTDPGVDLRTLHQQILTGDAELDWHAPAAAAAVEVVGEEPAPQEDAAVAGPSAAEPSSGPAARDELPRDIIDFTGRVAELTRLTTDADWRVAVIDGMAGIGKTALAVRVAHVLAPRHPGGRLHLDLHGHTPGRAPLDPGVGLLRLLTAIGVPADQIPDGVDERAAMWRTRVAGRSILLVLDNAATAEQVGPLLPGDPGCRVLVTTRRHLPALDGAYPMSLDVLTVEDALALFTATIGADRAQGQEAEVARAVRLCGQLPLAIRIAASRLRSRPSWTVAHLVTRLEQHGSLAELTVAERGVVAAFDLSYQQLDADQRRTFALLGLHPGTDIDATAAAALIGGTAARAERLLEELLDFRLLEQHSLDRYTFHDLLRDYARTAALTHEAEDVRTEARRRLSDHYLATAGAALDILVPAEKHRRPAYVRADDALPVLADSAAATAWLEAERPNLLALAAADAATGRPGPAVDLSLILWRFLERRGYLTDALTLHTVAVRAAASIGDELGEAGALRRLGTTQSHAGRQGEALETLRRALAIQERIGDVTRASTRNNMGMVYARMGRYQEAAVELGHALTLGRTHGDGVAEAQALNNLGPIQRRLGRYPEAVELFHQALALNHDTDNPVGEAIAHDNLGQLYRRLGEFDQSLHHHREALALGERLGVRADLGVTLDNLGLVFERLNRLDEAWEHLNRALAVAREAGDRYGEASALDGLGLVHLRLGRSDLALDHHRRAQAICEEIDYDSGRTEALNGSGETCRVMGDPAAAVEYHRAALPLAERTGDVHELARTHYGLALALLDRGEVGEAKEQGRIALAIFERLGVPESEALREVFAAVDADLATDLAADLAADLEADTDADDEG